MSQCVTVMSSENLAEPRTCFSRKEAVGARIRFAVSALWRSAHKMEDVGMKETTYSTQRINSS